jgi:hypothetical protein
MFQNTWSKIENETVYIAGQLQRDDVYLPPCVTSTNGFVPIINSSAQNKSYNQKQVVVGAERAQLGEEEKSD